MPAGLPIDGPGKTLIVCDRLDQEARGSLGRVSAVPAPSTRPRAAPRAADLRPQADRRGGPDAAAEHDDVLAPARWSTNAARQKPGGPPPLVAGQLAEEPQDAAELVLVDAGRPHLEAADHWPAACDPRRRGIEQQVEVAGPAGDGDPRGPARSSRSRSSPIRRPSPRTSAAGPRNARSSSDGRVLSARNGARAGSARWPLRAKCRECSWQRFRSPVRHPSPAGSPPGLVGSIRAQLTPFRSSPAAAAAAPSSDDAAQCTRTTQARRPATTSGRSRPCVRAAAHLG